MPLTRTLKLVLLVGLTAAYVGAANLGLSLANAHPNVSLVWPATGIALAAVFLLGYWVWPAVMLGAFLANAGTSIPIAAAAVIATGNTLEALLGAWLLLRFVGRPNPLDRAQDVFKFVALAVLLSTTVSASIGAASLCLWDAAAWAQYGFLWWTWWLGDAAGALIVTPVALAWNARRMIAREPRQMAEVMLLLALLTTASQGTFGGWLPSHLNNYPLAHVPIPFLIWAAVRFHQRTVTTAILIVAGTTTWGTAHGWGPFGTGLALNESLLLLHTYIAIVGMMSLVLTAVIAERKRVDDILRALIEGTAAATGKEFFAAFVKHLADGVGVRYAFVTELVDDRPSRLRVIAIWLKDRLGTPFEYELAHTPCEIVLKQGHACYRDSVQEVFPQDKDLSDLGVESYVGVALVGASGKTIGHICVLDDKPLSEKDAILPIMNAFAARAAAELQRKQAEEALRESVERFALVARATNDAVWDWDIVNNKAWWNEALYKWFGYPPETVPSFEAWAAKIHPEDKERVTTHFLAAVRQQDVESWSDEYRFQLADGNYGHIFDRAFILRDAAGKPIRTLGAMLNLTERKRMEDERTRMLDRLRALSTQLLEVRETERRQLSRDLHDEIGQAITAAQINLQSLCQGNPSLQDAKPLVDSLAVLDQMSQHVRDLCLELRPSLLDDLGLIPALRWFVNRQAERAGWEAEFSADDNLPPLLEKVQIACFRLAQEALTNALRHAKATRIGVSLERSGDSLVLTIQDNGVGFDPRHIATDRSHSFGLGILGMQERVRSLRGEFAVESQPRAGTVVTVRIPLVEMTLTAQPRHEEARR